MLIHEYLLKRSECMYIATSDEITEKLRDGIIYGEFSPNERLVEDSLAAKFETSRTPIREAIRNLSTIGLVKIIPNKGAMVAEVNMEEMKEMYVIRANLEGLAVKLATNNIPESIFPELEEMMQAMNDSFNNGDREGFEKWNTAFHLTIYGYCKNKMLTGMIRDLLDKSVLFRRSSWASPRLIKTVMEEHRDLLEALKKRDEKNAQEIVEKHTKLFTEKQSV